VVVPVYLWSLVLVAFNDALPYPRRMRIAIFALATALYVSRRSPFVECEDVAPILLLLASIHALVLRFGWSASSDLSPQLAKNLLAGAFAVQVWYEMGRALSGSMPIGDFVCSALKTSLFACLGLAAAGAFQHAAHRADDERHQKLGMKDSMETLTHELRSPLQGIMGTVSVLLDGYGEGSAAAAGASPEEVREGLSVVMASSRHLLTIINNMLDVRKCDARMMDEFPLSPVPLRRSLADAAAFCRPMAAVTGVGLRLAEAGGCEGEGGGGHDHDHDPAYVLSNVVRLQQMIINVVSNAIKYSPRGGTVVISAEITTARRARELAAGALAAGIPLSEMAGRDGDDDPTSLVAVVSVDDEGPGVAPGAAASRVFARFSSGGGPPSAAEGKAGGAGEAGAPAVQAPSVIGGSRVAQPSGTGLGLNLCVKFARRMGGNIWVSPNPRCGRGSRFSFCLPVSEPPPAEEGPPAPASAAAAGGAGPAGGGSGSAPAGSFPGPVDPGEVEAQANGEAAGSAGLSVSDLRVLVVDDTAINLKVVERMLRGVGVRAVSVADSGRQALSILERDGPFSLVITDIQMPGMDGIQLSRAIRGDGAIRAKPVVVGLTAETSDTIGERCLGAGMAHLLHKPITKGQLESFLVDRLRLRR
jgi:signal transduction histidine kinase